MFGLQDVLTVVGGLFDGIASGLIALHYGFSPVASGIGFLVGALGAILWGLCTPVSFQAETIVLVAGLGKDLKERLSIVVIAGVIMAVVGGFGLMEATMAFIGDTILAGMLAGVGIILARSGVDLAKEHLPSGVISFVVAIGVFAFTDNVAYMIAASVICATVVYVLTGKGQAGQETTASLETTKFGSKLTLHPPILNSWHVWRGALAVCCLQIGGNISYGTITAQIANMSPPVDKLTVMSALADIVSALFGGSPIEGIISATAAAPHPVSAAVVLMLIMAAILIVGLLPKLARYIPVSAAAGYLFVLGAFLVVPDNMLAALAVDPLVGTMTAVVTAISDPFIGMLAGLLTRFLM